MALMKKLLLIEHSLSTLSHVATEALRLDHVFSIRINRAVHIRQIQRFFNLISRMGDGPLWVGVILLLPVFFGYEGLIAMGHMTLFAALGLGVYKLIKKFTSRPRPFVQHQEIILGCPPLDQYSFPSGHTLHAVGYTLMLCYFFPALGVWFIPFALLVAASRIILGLHFVSDVLMGASIGTLLSLLIILSF